MLYFPEKLREVIIGNTILYFIFSWVGAAFISFIFTCCDYSSSGSSNFLLYISDGKTGIAVAIFGFFSQLIIVILHYVHTNIGDTEKRINHSFEQYRHVISEKNR